MSRLPPAFAQPPSPPTDTSLSTFLTLAVLAAPLILLFVYRTSQAPAGGLDGRGNPVNRTENADAVPGLFPSSGGGGKKKKKAKVVGETVNESEKAAGGVNDVGKGGVGVDSPGKKDQQGGANARQPGVGSAPNAAPPPRAQKADVATARKDKPASTNGASIPPPPAASKSSTSSPAPSRATNGRSRQPVEDPNFPSLEVLKAPKGKRPDDMALSKPVPPSKVASDTVEEEKQKGGEGEGLAVDGGEDSEDGEDTQSSEEGGGPEDGGSTGADENGVGWTQVGGTKPKPPTLRLTSLSSSSSSSTKSRSRPTPTASQVTKKQRENARLKARADAAREEARREQEQRLREFRNAQTKAPLPVGRVVRAGEPMGSGSGGTGKKMGTSRDDLEVYRQLWE